MLELIFHVKAFNEEKLKEKKKQKVMISGTDHGAYKCSALDYRV